MLLKGFYGNRLSGRSDHERLTVQVLGVFMPLAHDF